MVSPTSSLSTGRLERVGLSASHHFLGCGRHTRIRYRSSGLYSAFSPLSSCSSTISVLLLMLTSDTDSIRQSSSSGRGGSVSPPRFCVITSCPSLPSIP